MDSEGDGFVDGLGVGLDGDGLGVLDASTTVNDVIVTLSLGGPSVFEPPAVSGATPALAIFWITLRPEVIFPNTVYFVDNGVSL